MATRLQLVVQDPVTIYQEQGYVIFRQHLSLADCQFLTKRAQEQLRDLIFRDYPLNQRPDLTINSNRQLLTSQKYRQQQNYSNKIIWHNGLSRTPYWSKTTGMFNVYYDRDAQRRIHFNPQTFEQIAALYGHRQLTYTRGLDRLSIKYQGCPAMPTHLDCHLFDDTLNQDPHRVQAFVSVSVPDTDPAKPGFVPVNKSGTIQVIPYFHHYWSIAQRYFRADGPHQLSAEEYKNCLPQPWAKRFNQELPQFNLFLQDLHFWRDNQLNQMSGRFTSEYNQYTDLLATLPAKYRPLTWTPIRLQAGDLFCWNQRLPHASLANQSSTPRIVYYVTLLPRPSRQLGYTYDWAGSPAQQELITVLQQGYPGPGSIRNNELERHYLRPTDFQYWYRPTELPTRGNFTRLADYQRFCDYLQGL